MWVWEVELVGVGFRRQSVHYWKCEGRHGLARPHHISFFEGFHKAQGGRRAVDLEAFHVTFCLGVERLHFYYRDEGEGDFWPEGHTPSAHIRSLGYDPDDLKHTAEAVAQAIVGALGASWCGVVAEPGRRA